MTVLDFSQSAQVAGGDVEINLFSFFVDLFSKMCLKIGTVQFVFLLC